MESSRRACFRVANSSRRVAKEKLGQPSMRELCTSSHTHTRGLLHTRRDSLSTSLSRSLPERCWCVSMMPATPPPPLPSAAITARRRATDALSAGQLVALAGDDAAILQSWLRLPAMMQSDDWHVSRTRLWSVSCQPYDCSRVDTDFSEGIRNDVRCREEAL